jgi:hypothetical protein
MQTNTKFPSNLFSSVEDTVQTGLGFTWACAVRETQLTASILAIYVTKSSAFHVVSLCPV